MQSQATAPADSGPSPGKVCILLVDDQPANLLALEAVLADLGQDLVRAGSGAEALRLLEDHDCAVVLLDVQMQGLDGFETARRIRERERTRHTPIIFLTAYESPQFPVVKAYTLGAVDYLVKPLVPEILRAKVAVFVELFQEKQQARRLADQFRSLVQGTTDHAIFMLDPGGRVVTWNAGAERINGYSAAEIIGQHFSRFYPQEAIDRGWPAQELRRAEVEGRFEEEGWRLRKDGSRFWASVVLTALRDEAGQLRGFSKVTRDLTERKRAEDALRQLHQDLERRVRERTADLAASNQALEAEVAERQRAEQALREADRRKDQFLAMLAHELRNPLAPVLTGLHILRLSEADPGTAERARAMMERQVRHLTRLVDDLLDVSRIMRGRVEVRREHLDLAGLVRTTAEDRRPVLEQAGMSLVLDVPATPVWVAGDPTRLAQVLNNLLDNAVKFRDGGDRVTVRLAVDAARKQAVLDVQDTGVGIPPDLLPRLFDVFAQADRSLDRSRGGLGVGLAVVKGLVELHGGEVRAASGGPGQGAALTVRLPLEDAQAAPGAAPAAPERPAADSLRILVIEDNRDAADSLRTLLELLGHQVDVAYCGPDGVRRARAWRPDIVLCDIGLPGLDGYGVAGELRHDPATARVHLIAVTGYGEEEDRRRARQAGFDHHVTKPVDPSVLEPLLVRPA
jgi:PAS domain S-box-containing protein